MQGRGVVKPPTGIVFDTDFGNNIDSVLTLGFLRSVAGKGEARVISVSISKSTLKAAQAEDAITKFYEGPPPPGRGGAIGSPVGGNPDMVGLADNGKLAGDTPILDAIVAKKNAEGKPAYPGSIRSLLDTAEPRLTIRNILLAQNDLNAVVLLDGPATNVVQLMGLYGVGPQIVAKVKYLVAAVGSYPNGAPDQNTKNDIAAARKMFAEWPTPIIAVGTELGDALPYPAASIGKDFTWAVPSHPVVDAYKAFKTMPYDAPAPGLAAALYAAHPDDGYFKLSEPGTITVLDDGRTKFTPGAGGKHRYLIAEPAQKDKIIAMYAELVSAKPVPRAAFGFGRGRGRGGRGASGFGGRGASGAGGRGFLPASPPPVANVPPPQE